MFLVFWIEKKEKCAVYCTASFCAFLTNVGLSVASVDSRQVVIYCMNPCVNECECGEANMLELCASIIGLEQNPSTVVDMDIRKLIVFSTGPILTSLSLARLLYTTPYCRH